MTPWGSSWYLSHKAGSRNAPLLGYGQGGASSAPLTHSAATSLRPSGSRNSRAYLDRISQPLPPLPARRLRPMRYHVPGQYGREYECESSAGSSSSSSSSKVSASLELLLETPSRSPSPDLQEEVIVSVCHPSKKLRRSPRGMYAASVFEDR